jgi:hypothetical protein
MATQSTWFAACISVVLFLPALARGAEDAVFSGPQAGETITSFRVLGVTGSAAGKEREISAGDASGATVLVFVHGIERSIVPLMTVVDQYCHERRDSLAAEFVFLTDDRAAAEKRLPLVGRSLRMQSPMSVSLDGPEGPGNYGLNKTCLMTIVVAKGGKVTANFALVQPGIADAPAVVGAVAKACGDASPPTPADLRDRRQKAAGDKGGRGEGRMEDRGPRSETNGKAKTDLPGAAPTDAKLLALLRSFIQKANDKADVDRVVREVEGYVKDDADLTRQAVNGWTRVLHLQYGTDYAHTAGRQMVERLKKDR